MILLLLLVVLFCDKKGLMVGQKSLDFGPPPHLSRKYMEIDSLLTFVFKLRKMVKFFFPIFTCSIFIVGISSLSSFIDNFPISRVHIRW